MEEVENEDYISCAANTAEGKLAGSIAIRLQQTDRVRLKSMGNEPGIQVCSILVVVQHTFREPMLSVLGFSVSLTGCACTCGGATLREQRHVWKVRNVLHPTTCFRFCPSHLRVRIVFSLVTRSVVPTG